MLKTMAVKTVKLYYGVNAYDASPPQIASARFPDQIPEAADLTRTVYEVVKAMGRLSTHLTGTWAEQVDWTLGESLIIRGNGWLVVYDSEPQSAALGG